MTKEEKRKYHKEYRESHKEEIKEYHRNYYETHKEKMKDCFKKYHEDHKEEKKEYDRKYNESHKERFKKYRENHREEINIQSKESYNKRANSLINIFQVYRYFRKNYSRYISLENYITIMKMNNYSSKHSIMIRLGQGMIDENEAVALSGMILSDEEKNELKNIFNNLDIKRK